MLKTYFLIFIILLVKVTEAKYRFFPLETDIGINMVRSLYRDHRGYLWIGNQRTGLMRYDGYEIKRFLHNAKDSSSISSDAIFSIFEDSHKQLWVGTADGLNRYIPENDQFVKYELEKESKLHLSSNFINKIVESPDSTLWALTQNGIFKYDRPNNQFERFFIKQNSNKNNYTCIAWDNNKLMWCGENHNNGLYKVNPENGSYEFYRDKSVPKQQVGNKTLLIDSNNVFWYGHRGVGLAQFKPETGQYDYFPVNNNSFGTFGNFIYDILEVDSANLFIGIDQGGINILNRKTRSFKYITNDNPLYGKLGSNGIFCIHIDYEGIVWVGTSRGGVSYSNIKEARFDTHKPMIISRIRKNQQSYYPSYGFHSVFLEDSKGLIWIGTDGGGVNIYNRKTERFSVINKDLSPGFNVVRSIAEDANGDIWLTPWEGEIIRYNPLTRKHTVEEFERPKLVELNANTFWNMTIDSKGRFWITYTFGEIALYDKNKKWINQYFVGDSIRYMDTKIYESADSTIFAASRKGIFKYDPSTDKMKAIAKIDDVASMDFGDTTDIWFGTDFGELYSCSYNGAHLKKHRVSMNNEKLPIKALAFENGQIWMSSNRGIAIYDIHSGKTTGFDKQDGLQGNQFFLQSVLKAKDGQLFFGGNNGFSAFYPDKMQSNKAIPPVYITDLYISRDKIDPQKDTTILKQKTDFTKEIEIHWQSKLSLEFRFVAVSYTFPNKNRYQYKLQGFDNSWNETDAFSRKAIYTNLNPGEYTFHVKACNNDGLWNEEGSSLKIIITPAFWEETWFYIIESIFLLILIVSIVIYREKKIKRDSKILQQKVDQRTKVIQDQKEKLDKQNHLLSEQFEELEAKQEELRVQNEELNLHRNNLQSMVDQRTADLLEAKEKAEEADRLKSSFLANMSHEIRTPMNAIIGFSTLLTSPEISDEEKKNFVSLITSNSEALLHLVEDILDFSMIESNQMKIHLKEFNINDLVENVFASFALRKKLYMVDLRLRNILEHEEISIISDEYRIRQIITNLMSNAIKFTTKGYIELGTRRNNSTLEIFVKDTGVGMTQKEQNMIFKQFVKLQKDQYSNIRGIGLGLSISKRLAMILKGDLYVVSEKGKGSEFILSLPLKNNKIAL